MACQVSAAFSPGASPWARAPQWRPPPLMPPDNPEKSQPEFTYPEPVLRHLREVERIGVLLLAAGASRRMGTPKALLRWKGRPLIQHQLAALGRLPFASVVVVLGHDEPAIGAAIRPDPALRLAYNPRHPSGRSSSIRLGAHLLNDLDAILIVSVDQPLAPLLLSDLLAGARRTPSGAHPHARARRSAWPPGADSTPRLPGIDRLERTDIRP